LETLKVFGNTARSEPAETATTPTDLETPSRAEIIERCDGLFQIGLDDETSSGPFISRQHALAVAAKAAA
jgi:hypothetical protein